MARRSAAAGSSSGERHGVRGDPLDEAGQDATGPDLDEGGDAGSGIASMAPTQSTPVVRWSTSSSRQPSAVVIGRASALASSGGLRVAEGDAGEDVAHGRRRPRPSAASARRPTPAARSRAWRRAPLRSTSDASTAGRSPGDHDLARRVPVRDAEDALGRRSFDELGQPGVVEADDRGHPALATGPGRLHLLAAVAHEADGRRARSSAPAATSAEYWPIEWPAAKAGAGTSTPSCRPALAHASR